METDTINPSSKRMHRIFDDEKLEELKELYQTGAYTKTDLAVRYECSVTTICLWLNPDEEVRKKKFKSREAKPHCDCGVAHEKHARCGICKVHMHTPLQLMGLDDYYIFGKQSLSKKVCDMCYEEYRDKTIELKGYYKLGPDYVEYTVTINPYTKEISI